MAEPELPTVPATGGVAHGVPLGRAFGRLAASADARPDVAAAAAHGLAARSLRRAELLGFVAPLLLAPALGPQLAARSGGRQVSFLDRAMAALAKPARPRGFALAGAMALGLSAIALRGGIERGGDAITPVGALAAVAEHHVEGPVFNDYAFGGYLIFAGIKPFIDGRYLYGDAFIKRYAAAALAAGDQLPQLLAEYHIAWTLLGAKTPAVVLLDHLPGWRRLYADDIAVVHVRTDGASLCPVSARWVSRGHDERCPEQQRQPSDPMALGAKTWLSRRFNRNYVRVSPNLCRRAIDGVLRRVLRESCLPRA